MTPPTMAGYHSSLEKWFKRLVRISLCILALPFAGMFVVVFNGFRNEAEAVERARAVPQHERQAILSLCVDLSRGLKEDHDELIFYAEPFPKQQPIPQTFAGLLPKRVNISRKRASIKLHFLVDSGVFIYCQGLDTPSPTATLSWGETENPEPWASLEPPK